MLANGKCWSGSGRIGPLDEARRCHSNTWFASGRRPDLRAGELRKKGSRIRLQEQPLQVLAMLLEQPGEVVTRDELRARLWGSETFVDFEHGLHAAVNKLRSALNDAADRPRYIETIPRRGYRFVGTIDTSQPGRRTGRRRPPTQAARNPHPSATLLPTDGRSSRSAQVLLRRYCSLSAVLVVSAATSTSHAPDRLMLAVLPFENLSGDPEQEYFTEGLTEELITGLGQLDAARLGVIARTSVMKYKRAETGPADQSRAGRGLRARRKRETCRCANPRHRRAHPDERRDPRLVGEATTARSATSFPSRPRLRARWPASSSAGCPACNRPRRQPVSRSSGRRAKRRYAAAISWSSERLRAFAKRASISNAPSPWSRPMPSLTSAWRTRTSSR